MPAKTKTTKAQLSAQLNARSVALKLSAETAGAEQSELTLLPILPASPFTTVSHDYRSGIQFIFDRSELIENFNQRGRKFSLSIEHGVTPDRRSRGYCVEFTDSEREPDYDMQPGLLYGWFKLSKLGKEELADELWLYTSAELQGSWLDEQTYRIKSVTGHTLTNGPASEMPANFTAQDASDASAVSEYTEHQHTDYDSVMLTAILQKLGLAEDATQEQITAALDALLSAKTSLTSIETATQSVGLSVADIAAGAVAKSTDLTAAKEQAQSLSVQVQELTAKLQGAEKKLTAIEAAARQAQIFSAVDAVIAAGKASADARETLAKLAAADLTAFTQSFEAVKAAKLDERVARDPVTAEDHGLTAEQLSAAEQAGVSPATYAAEYEKARALLGLN